MFAFEGLMGANKVIAIHVDCERSVLLTSLFALHSSEFGGEAWITLCKKEWFSPIPRLRNVMFGSRYSSIVGKSNCFTPTTKCLVLRTSIFLTLPLAYLEPLRMENPEVETTIIGGTMDDRPQRHTFIIVLDITLVIACSTKADELGDI